MQKLRAAISEHVPESISQLVAAARGGDIQAARLILERVLPPVKAVEQAVELQLPDGGIADSPRPATERDLLRLGFAHNSVVTANTERTASARASRYGGINSGLALHHGPHDNATT